MRSSKLQRRNTDTVRVLVIDDNVLNQQMVQDLLEAHGMEARTAGPETAQDVLRAWQPDAALIDIAMPGLDGTQLAAWAQRHCPRTRLVLYSGFTGQPELELAAKMVNVPFLPKPFEIDHLLALLRGEPPPSRT
jgi:CheY-like chemotaxis protein